MADREKSVVRFRDGRMLKGYLSGFSPHAEKGVVEEETGASHSVSVEELKAVFFVRSFEGDQSHKEKKSYGSSHVKGHRAFVKFKDGESMVGFLDGSVPWERGFFLSRREGDTKGFFVYPADSEANNIRVFVVASAVSDVTVVP